MKPDVQTEQPLRDHLQEFRKRLIICLVVVAIAALACYNYVDDIIALLSGPAGKLYFMNPSEVFFTYMEIALYAGILFTLPVLLYEVWAFVAPALWPEERRAVLVILPTAVILFYVGLVFAYYLVIPAAVTFFMGFATQTLQPMFSLESYLSFILALTLPFGFIFELPLIFSQDRAGNRRLFKGKTEDFNCYCLYLCRCRIPYYGYIYADNDCRATHCIV